MSVSGPKKTFIFSLCDLLEHTSRSLKVILVFSTSSKVVIFESFDFHWSPRRFQLATCKITILGSPFSNVTFWDQKVRPVCGGLNKVTLFFSCFSDFQKWRFGVIPEISAIGFAPFLKGPFSNFLGLVRNRHPITIFALFVVHALRLPIGPCIFS